VQDKISMPRAKHTRPKGKRLTIGYLTPIIRASRDQWLGIADAAQERDVNLICFEGGSLVDHSGFHAQASVLYDLVSAERIDGVICWTSLIATRADDNKIRTFHDRYRHLPMVTLGQTLEGIPSLFTDSYDGMYEAVIHLIEVHGYRRLAFIKGPEDSFYTQERYRAYTDALKAQGISPDPNLVTPPAQAWELAEGKRAMRLLLDERGLRPQIDLEAVVSTSDLMLLGVLEVLRERGIKVPGEVAIVGFDNLAHSRASTPPFTSVVSPFYEVGYQAVEMLLALIKGVQIPQKVFVPTRMVIRQSCGCQPLTVTQVPIGPVKAVGEKFEIGSTAWRSDILAAMLQATDESLSGMREWVGQLLDGFSAEMQGTQGVFLSKLNEVLHQTMMVDGDVAAWQGVISVLRRYWFPYLDDKELLQAEDLWHQARVVIGETAQRIQVYQQLQAEQQARALREIGAALIATLNVEELMSVVAERLPSLGIPSCYVSLYEDPKAPTERARLILAYNEKGRIELKPGGQRFPSRQLAPEDLMPQDRRYSMVAESLYFQQNQIGLALFEVGPRKESVYEALRVQLSSALEGVLLLQKHMQAEDALARQAQELARSNTELEQFAYIASHDLQEPLRMVKSYLQLIRRRYQNQLDEDADDFINFAVDGAERMQALINDLLEYSRVATHGKSFEPTDCSAVLDHTLANLKIAIEESGAVVTYHELPVVLADATQLLQLFQNLISNAIKFRKEEIRPEIHISAKHTSGQWTFSVRDNGVGIAPEYFERIFIIFKRLHNREAYEGTGVGLAMCKKIVERHGGRIWVKSKPGKGSTFYFTLLDRGDSAS
jgi:signal transduction histidine kinase/DNA-binding LacI/PurR family transcriptional regulator